MVTPLVVIVLPVVVALNVIVPLLLHTVPVSNVKDPLTVREGDTPFAKVTVPAVTVRSKQVNPLDNVTVYVPVRSKNTESAAVGADAPLAPPGVADQLVVEVVLQVPEPPTQYLLAMFRHLQQEYLAAWLRQQSNYPDAVAS